MYFYLKETKSKTKTLIYFKYKNGSEKRFVYSTKVRIFPNDWDFDAKFIKSKKGRTDLYILSKKISVYLDYFNLLVSNYELKNEKLTHERLSTEFDNKFKKKNNLVSVTDWFDIMIDEKRAPNSKTYKQYVIAKKNLIKYAKNRNKEITFEIFENFNDYIKFAYNNFDYNDNTLSRHLRFIKTFVIWSYKKKLHDIRDYSTMTLKSYSTDSVALTKKQLFELYDYEFENEELQEVIDLFLIGCFTGQRFSDFSVFDKLDYHDGYINKRQKKTKAKVSIPIDANQMLKTLLTKYDFDLPKFENATFNTTLKEAVSKLKSFQHDTKKTSYKNGAPIVTVAKFWKMVGSHTARRTFITVTLEDNWTYKEVMQVSGIRDIRTLMKYDKVSNERLNKKTKETWRKTKANS